MINNLLEKYRIYERKNEIRVLTNKEKWYMLSVANKQIHDAEKGGAWMTLYEGLNILLMTIQLLMTAVSMIQHL